MYQLTHERQIKISSLIMYYCFYS